jgi:hypothetical protein
MDTGRPTKYKQEFDLQAEKLCKLGATDQELADFFEVNVDTIHEWKKVHPEFSDSIKQGKILADSNVAQSLYHRATGYEHEDVDIKVVNGEIVTTPLTKYYPPDTAAAIFWLKNRQKKKWRDKIEHGLTDGEGNDVEPAVHIFKLPDNGRGSLETKD